MIQYQLPDHRENVALLKKRLADPNTTEAEREVILKLLAEEEAKSFRKQKMTTNVDLYQTMASTYRLDGMLRMPPAGRSY